MRSKGGTLPRPARCSPGWRVIEKLASNSGQARLSLRRSLELVGQSWLGVPLNLQLRAQSENFAENASDPEGHVLGFRAALARDSWALLGPRC
jgi:hypothetical protein